jgi:hypothetical protein
VKRLPLPAVLLSGLVAAAAVAATPPASGTFKSKSVSVPIAGAYAFHDKATLGDTPVIVVAVSNKGFAAPALDEYLDRRVLIDTSFKDEQTAVVYFELGLDGKYRGYSYYFGSGNGCGYCTGDAVGATTTVNAGRVVGRLRQVGDPAFDITLDVPIASDDHGAALPAGGGEPGKAFQALAAAIGRGDAPAAKALLCAEQAQTWDALKKGGKDPLAVLGAGLPGDIEIEGGFAGAQRANLRAHGKDRVLGAVKGEILMRKEKGSWRYTDAILTPAKP